MTVPGVMYVVAKAPRPGACKTRLCPPLTPEQAAELAAAFLLDTLVVVHQAGLIPRVMCCGPEDQQLLQAMLPMVHVSSQNGHGLGDALETAFAQGLADGFERVAVLGADSPTLPATILRQAFSALETDRAVALGPSRDGGYYLLAARRVHPTLFREMTWSTSDVAAETLGRAYAARLETHLLPIWYDVDDVASLADLDAELQRLPAVVAPRTRTARSQAGQPIDSGQLAPCRARA